jgi:hypothetical protein
MWRLRRWAQETTNVEEDGDVEARVMLSQRPGLYLDPILPVK